jgi:hypothetical protein
MYRYFVGKLELQIRYINYLDAVYFGVRPADPFDAVEWGGHGFERENLRLRANLMWCQLRLVILGFDSIREAALKEGRDFPFENPRMLFVEILREQFSQDCKALLADGILQGSSITEIRKTGKQQSALYRGRHGGDSVEQEFLDICKRSGWSGFWKYAIWDKRFSKSLRHDWERFLRSHKAEVAFTTQNQCTSVFFTKGRPVTTSRKTTGSLSNLQGEIIY